MTEMEKRIVVGLGLFVLGGLSYTVLPGQILLVVWVMLGYGLFKESCDITYGNGHYWLPFLMMSSVVIGFSYVVFMPSNSIMILTVMAYFIGFSWLFRVSEMLFLSQRFFSKHGLFVLQLCDLSAFLLSFSVLYLYNKWLLLWVILVVSGIDTVGYFVGRFWGVVKVCPNISPKKTREGYLGSLVWVIILGVGMFMIDKKMSILPLTLYMVVIYILSITGDLLVSYQKRLLHVKDSGSILPGHGGLLDRFDSWIFVLVFVLICSVMIN